MFKPGSIRKVVVKNFVTYTYAELIPGPKLNLILGPNGTGKSTMVAAIILGLGGSPKVVGRGTKLGEFIKHNFDFAIINVYLESDRTNSVIKITREFDLAGNTSWHLNDQSCNFTKIKDVIKKFNIQVDNLCQFLPQDRVQDFAKLNKQELLKQTVIALCREDLIEKQEKLIETQQHHLELVKNFNNETSNLQSSIDANARLEGRVKNFQKQLKYKEAIKDIERKIEWVSYEDMRSELAEIKRDKDNAKGILAGHKTKLQPIQDKINRKKKQLTSLQHHNTTVSQKIRDCETAVKNLKERVKGVKTNIETVTENRDEQLAEISQWDQEIDNSLKKLEEMRNLYTQAQIKNKEGEKEKQMIVNEIMNCNNQMEPLRTKKEKLDEALDAVRSELRALTFEITRIENVKSQRLDKLYRVNSDAHKAVTWLRNNKNLFSDEIFEPMLLEINILDVNKAKYVESCIPMREKVAFTCVNKTDMNKLIQHLRVEQKLSVNMLHAGAPARPQEFQPDQPIENLRKYGFYTYVASLFTAPEPIKRYLCRTYRLHNIPVGDDTTNKHYTNLPKHIGNFFSDKYRFSITYSKYSGEKSVRENEVFSDGSLSLSLDVLRLENMKGREKELNGYLASRDKLADRCDSEINQVKQNVSRLRDKMKDLDKEKRHAEAIDSRIRAAQNSLNDMRRNKKNPEQIRQEAKKKIDKLIETFHGLHKELQNSFKKFSQLSMECGANVVKIENMRESMAYNENHSAQLQNDYREAEERFNVINDKYVALMTETKKQLNVAKQLSNGFTPADAGFDEFKANYEALPDDVKELNISKELLLSRMDCLTTANNAEITEYEERINTIEQLQKNIKHYENNISTTLNRLTRLQREWLEPLNELVASIDLRFGTAFGRMGCAGEISITPGANEQDFSQYGLSIKVTYRSTEPMQELNSTTQSGGERAVATAVYMLALQELTPVPFRCVDEINQGMDAVNEKRIMEFLVESTCQEETTSQYFLVSPKLIPNFNYHKEMNIHIVFNGPFINPDRKWNFAQICNPHNVHFK